MGESIIAILDTNIEGKLKKYILDKYRASYRKSGPKLRQILRQYFDFKIRKGFLESKTVDSLVNFGLRRDFGLTDPEGKVETIIQLISQSIEVKVSTPRSGNKFFISVSILRNGLENLYLNPDALQENTNVDGGPPAPNRPDFIPWLEWLTERGTEVVVSDFFVKTSNPEVIGRSGKVGFMFPTNINHEKGFSINRDHAGTIGNNFITDILNQVGLDAKEELWALVRPVIAQIS